MTHDFSLVDLRLMTLDGLVFCRYAASNVQSALSREALEQLVRAKENLLGTLENNVSAAAAAAAAAAPDQVNNPCYLVHEEYRVLAALIKGRPWMLPLREIRHIERWILDALETAVGRQNGPAPRTALKRYASRVSVALGRLEEPSHIKVPGVYRSPNRVSSFIV